MEKNKTKNNKLKRFKQIIWGIIVVFVLVIVGCHLYSYIPTFSDSEIASYTEEIETNYLESNFMVYIDNYYSKEDKQFYKRNIGSAFTYKFEDNRYYLITNEHVVNVTIEEEITKSVLTVVDYIGKEYNAVVENYDASIDTAVISFEKTTIDYRLLELSKSSPSLKQKVISISSPKGVQNTITFGAIKNFDLDKIYSTAKIEVGSSGSPLLDKDFKVIGLVNSCNQTLLGEWKETIAIRIDKVISFLENNELS